MKNIFRVLKAHWQIMSIYERFEQVVALVLTALIAIVILVALKDLVGEIWRLLHAHNLDLLEHSKFQGLFGQIMTLLIALEFKHSILKVVARKDSIVQVKTVLLIALLALARKFIILDIQSATAETIFSFAAAVIALSISYWLIKEGNEKKAEALQARTIEMTTK